MNRFTGATLILLTCSLTLLADTPTVTFDTDTQVSCKVVSGDTQGSNTKLIEVVLRISAAIDGDEEDVSEIEYEVGQIWEPGFGGTGVWDDYRPEVITDFLPRTKMYSDIVGTKVIIESVENGISGDLSGSYTQVLPTGGAANAGGGVRGSHTTASLATSPSQRPSRTNGTGDFSIMFG